MTNLFNFVSPYGKTPITISTNQPKSTINDLRQRVLQQGQAGLRWGNSLSCKYLIEDNGLSIIQKPVLIDIVTATEFSNQSDYIELRGLPGLGAKGGGGPIKGAWVGNEDWFTAPISFGLNFDELNENSSDDSPDGGNLVKKFQKSELPSQFQKPGKFVINFGIACSNSLDPSYDFKSTKLLNIYIMPKNGQATFIFTNPKQVSITERAIDISISSENDTNPIFLKSLTPKICIAFSTSVVLKSIGTCTLQINQQGNEDYASLSQNFSFAVTSQVKKTTPKPRKTI